MDLMVAIQGGRRLSSLGRQPAPFLEKPRIPANDLGGSASPPAVEVTVKGVVFDTSAHTRDLFIVLSCSLAI